MNWTDVMNDHTAKNIMALSVADQKQVIRDYCNEHPLASYVEAVLDLYNRLPNSDVHEQNNHWPAESATDRVNIAKLPELLSRHKTWGVR